MLSKEDDKKKTFRSSDQPTCVLQKCIIICNNHFYTTVQCVTIQHGKKDMSK